ncbi:ABC transporter permease [Paenibacillus sp. IB182496]|uniref:Transport permease protein n=1 Tax=Paenibacillus sabuli TaxID=2772509 RepID=A0A927GRW3_9BACL|nr:ABC transporter permease [Paenibacillus sabuli]MBD2845928.1 ABC transporter permease [Paenibacillus sabuli]
MRNYLSEILKRKDLLIYLVKSGLKAEHRNSYLGYFWWLLDPLLGALIYYFLVVVILGRGGENYGVFLVIGLVAWRWTSSAVNSSSKAITSYTSIINQVYLPKAIFPMTRTFAQLINFVFGLAVIAIFLAFFGIMPSWHIVYLPFIMLVQLLFLISISLFLAYICVFVRDIDNILSHFIRLWFYASPVIWEGGRLPEQYQWIVNINPFAHIVTSYRNIFMYHQMPNLINLTVTGIASLLLIICLLLFYSKNEHKIIKAL